MVALEEDPVFAGVRLELLGLQGNPVDDSVENWWAVLEPAFLDVWVGWLAAGWVVDMSVVG